MARDAPAQFFRLGRRFEEDLVKLFSMLLRSLLCAAVLSAATVAQAGPTYRVTLLGGEAIRGAGMNDLGQVAGTANGHAFVYSNGLVTDLGTLGGLFSSGNDINNGGQVAGSSWTTGPYDFNHAFKYSNGLMSDLGTLGGVASFASDINNAGQVAGWSYTIPADGTTFDFSTSHAFLYSNGNMTDLGTFGGLRSEAQGINDAGQVTGHAYTLGDVVAHAFVYSNGLMTDLGTLGGTFSTGWAINDAGQVTGYSTDAANHARAFLYSNGAMTDIGTLGGSGAVGISINSFAQIVGFSELASSDGRHGFIYSDGVMTDLNDMLDPVSGAGLVVAGGLVINDAGQILVDVAFASGKGSMMSAVLTPVPEPATYALMLAGLAAFIIVAKRRSVSRN